MANEIPVYKEDSASGLSAALFKNAQETKAHIDKLLLENPILDKLVSTRSDSSPNMTTNQDLEFSPPTRDIRQSVESPLRQEINA